MAASETRHLIDTVTGEASRLRDFLAGMVAQTWTSDSTCDEWTIEDVVAHLAGGAVGRANAINRAVAGDAGPPEGQSFLPLLCRFRLPCPVAYPHYPKVIGGGL